MFLIPIIILILFAIIYLLSTLFSENWLIFPIGIAAIILVVAIISYVLFPFNTKTELSEFAKQENRKFRRRFFYFLSAGIIVCGAVFIMSYHFHLWQEKFNLQMQKLNSQLQDLERSNTNSALSSHIQESKKQLDAKYAYSTHMIVARQKADQLIKARGQLMQAMVKMREYRAIAYLSCKNGKYDRHFSSDDLSKLYLAGINLSGAVQECGFVFGEHTTMQSKINEFVSLSDVNKVCQKGSATDKELGPLQNQIDTLIWNAIDAVKDKQQHK